jgi:4-hydroxybenzoate polyprenyltransferase
LIDTLHSSTEFPLLQKNGTSLSLETISMVKHILISMRLKQWVKNLFIFAGLVFSGNLFHLAALSRICTGFILFGFVASSIYIFNDIHDLEQDKTHPVKRGRPLAAGCLSIPVALGSAVIFAAFGLGVASVLHWHFFGILVGYFIINVAYTLKLKEFVILDVMCIASGFVLRVLSGTLLAEVKPSDWLLLCTITLSLFLGFSKRRQEILLKGAEADRHRKVLGQYSITFLDQMIAIATACTVMSYALYTVSPQTVARFGTRNLVFTIPFVLYGIYRYLFLTHQKKGGGDPTSELLTDFPMLINAVLWCLVVTLIIYWKP